MHEQFVARLAAADDSMLAPLVGRMLDAEIYAVTQWRYELLYGGFGQTISGVYGVYRFQGEAETTTGLQGWSLILKAMSGAADSGSNQPDAWNYWKREALLYKSGLLDSLGNVLVAPRCYGVVEYPDQEMWIWLEDIHEEGPRIWPFDRYAVAADHLGQFNGAYLIGHTLPNEPWLNSGDWRARLGQGAHILGDIQTWTKHPVVQRWLDGDIAERIAWVWDKRAELFDGLESIPRCFCHCDSYRRNLMARTAADGHDQTVAVDWAFAGVSVAGEDAAKLLVSSMSYVERPAAEIPALAKAIFDGYATGLRTAGWRGDPAPIRRGYHTISFFVCMEHLWLGINGIQSGLDVSVAERVFGHPFDTIVEQQAVLSRHCLDLAEQVLNATATGGIYARD